MSGRQFLAGTALVFTSFLLVARARAAAEMYDLSTGFPISANPQGAWTVGWKSTVGGSLTPYTYHTVQPFPNGVPSEVWSRGAGSIPIAGKNTSSQTGISDGGQGNYPAGTVFFYAGPDGSLQNYSAIRFTTQAGSAGLYNLTSVVRTYLEAPLGQDADFHVAVRGVEVFGANLAPSSSTNYTNQVVLLPGDTVDFLAGRGPDGHQYASGLKISAALTLLAMLPSVEIAVETVKVTQHVAPGVQYVLESSFDLVTWSQTGSQFTASSEEIVSSFKVDQTGRYFRLRVVP
ncbi:MAG TPA: hypothetical protein DCM86_07995 [Verrucomicrobiales bacterium]|nr:hypothetical protein [Verrucomicrobiales bacterium]